MAEKFTCEQVARAGLGDPAKREGMELLYHCPHPEGHKNGDSHPSLKVNPKKNAWMCGPCGASGNAWELAAFLFGKGWKWESLSDNDREAVKAWLSEKGLFAKGERKGKAKSGRGPCVASYIYSDVQGNPLARKLRFEPGEDGKKKSFAWEHFENGKWVSGLGNVKTPLYRIAKCVNEPYVVLTEGEKDADAGAAIGLPTATSGGVGSWREDHAATLQGKRVVIIGDADTPGRIHAQQVGASLYGKAASVKVCEIPGAKDLAEGIEKGANREGLLALFEETSEWRPASGAEILDMVMALVRRFVSMTAHQARAVSLWTVHTHAFDAADCTPYLNPNSAEKQSGKTRLLEVLEKIVLNPWLTGRTSAAALVRKVHGERPTLLLDESDTAFQQEKEYVSALRGILNSGYRKSGKASLCIGQGAAMDVKDFNTFSAKAIAGISRLPDTVADRSIPIRLKRAKRGEVCKFREREAHREGSELSARLAVWSAANLETLRQARPDIPAQLSDRQADCCEPLLAIADLAGGDWPETARAALVELCGEAEADDESIGVRLLQDVRAIFKREQVEEIPSAELCEALAKVETSPWGEWSHDKPITPARLARLLKPFEIVPDRIGGKDSQSRGYTLRQFKDAFFRYLPSSPRFQTVNLSTNQCLRGPGEDFKPSAESVVDTVENTVSPNKNAGGGRVDTLKLKYGEQANRERDIMEL
jgi:hypothetical protein